MYSVKYRPIRNMLATAVAFIILFFQTAGLGEYYTWNCPECGRIGNNGNYCGGCAHPAPWLENESTTPAEEDGLGWKCPVCGHEGNTGKFCPFCGNEQYPSEKDQDLTETITMGGENIQPGYRFYFGTFEQDGFLVNGEEPIVWRVLETDESKKSVLALSEYGLYTMKYHRNDKETRWEDTDVRDWLNSTFLNSFTQEERKKIIRTTISDSEDDVFLLDSEQITRYLDNPYLCYATPWALNHGENGAYVNEDTGASSWLVRMDTAKKRIAWVGGAGKLYSPDGSKGINYLTSKDNVVRPALWVSMDAAKQEATDYGFPLYAKAITTIATRSGPTTGYTGLGSYPINGQTVRVLSRVNDGSIWWLQIEFEYNNKIIRCYTGLKRVNIAISKVPDEVSDAIGDGEVIMDTAAYYGPGKEYKEHQTKMMPKAGTTGKVINRTNGWVCFEYDYSQEKETARVWLPEEAISITR